LKKFKPLLIAFLFFASFPARGQSDCVGPEAQRKIFSFRPPRWDPIGQDAWENPGHSAQIQLRTQFLKPEVTVKKYQEEYPQNLKDAQVQISKTKRIKVGGLDAFMIEGKQPTGSQIAKLKSITVFGDSTLYFFTLIANTDAYAQSKKCFDAVVKSLREKN